MFGRKPKALKCNNCGGALPPPLPGHRYVECTYCGMSIDLGPRQIPQAPPARPQAPPAYPQPPRVSPQAPSAPSGSSKSPFIVLGAVVAFMTLMGAFSFVMSTHAQEIGARAAAAQEAQEQARKAAAKAAASHRVQWGGGASDDPILTGAGTDDFIGFYREGDELYVGGFNGATFRRVWRAGPYASDDDQAEDAYLALNLGAVLVSDHRHLLHVLDLASGEERRAITLSDTLAEEPCAVGRSDVWVRLTDERDVTIDPATGEQTRAKRPRWCPEPDSSSACGSYARHAECADGRGRIPKQKGLAIEAVLTEGNRQVALAVKSPGTAVAYVLGFRKGARKPAFKEAVAPGDPFLAVPRLGLAEVHYGRLFATYTVEATGVTHLVAMDIRSGERSWDVEVPRDLLPARTMNGSEAFRRALLRRASLVAGKDRVYLAASSQLAAFDAKTGHLVGTIGAR